MVYFFIEYIPPCRTNLIKVYEGGIFLHIFTTRSHSVESTKKYRQKVRNLVIFSDSNYKKRDVRERINEGIILADLNNFFSRYHFVIGNN